MLRRAFIGLVGAALLAPYERVREYSFLWPAPSGRLLLADCVVDILPEHCHSRWFSPGDESSHGDITVLGSIFKIPPGISPRFGLIVSASDVQPEPTVFDVPLPRGALLMITPATHGYRITSADVVAAVRREARRLESVSRYC